MAENSVPLGQAGTGAAFVLGENRALQQFNKNYALQQEQQQLKREKAAQELANSYRKNMLAAGDGKLFARELGDLEQKHIKQGMDYRAQGFDIYNPNPNDPKQLEASQQYMTDRRMIENLRAYRKGIEDEFNKVNTAIAKSKTGEYRQEDINAMHDFINNRSIIDLYNSGENLPQVRKSFDEAGALKGVKASTDLNKMISGGNMVEITKLNVPRTEQAILASIASQQGGEEYLNEVTKGLPVNFIKQLPSSREEIRKMVESDIDGGSKKQREQLAAMGIVKGSKRYNDYIEQSTNDYFDAKQGYNGLMERGMGMASRGLKLGEKVTPLITPYQQQTLAMARERLRMAKDNQSKKGQPTESELFRQQWVDDMLNGVEGSGEQLKAVLGGMGNYVDTEIPYAIQKDPKKPNTIIFRIPEKRVGDKITPYRVVEIDRTDKNADIKLNEMLNQVTGEKVNLSKFKTGNASGKTTATKSKTVPLSTIKGLVGKKGYEGYSEKELVDYYKSQGYKIQ